MSLTPNHNPWAARVLLKLGRFGLKRMFRVWAVFLNCDLECRDYGRFYLPHPFGIVIHARTQIGQGCTIYQHVTIGTADGTDVSAEIADGVVIGAGAVILGDIRVGRGARVGANAVVLNDVPAGVTVVGNPARALMSSHDDA